MSNSHMGERFEFELGNAEEFDERVEVLNAQVLSTVELGPVISWV